jgi:PKD repeat protein
MNYFKLNLSKQIFQKIKIVCFFYIGFFWGISYSSGYSQILQPLNQSVYLNTNDSIYFSWDFESTNGYILDYSNNSNFISFDSVSTFSTNVFIPKSILNSTNFWRLRYNNDTSSVYSFKLIDLNSLGLMSLNFNAQNNVTHNNNSVSSWIDISNSNINASQTVTSRMPELIPSLIFGKDVLKFGGNTGSSSSFLLFNQLSILDTNFTIILAYKQISLNAPISYPLGSGSPKSGVISGGSFGTGRNFGITCANATFLSPGTTNLNWAIRSAKYNKLYLNSLPISGSTGSILDSIHINAIGVRPDNLATNFHGFIGDIIIFNEILSDSSRFLVESYLKTKYTPFPDLGKDTILCNDTYKIGVPKDHGYSQILWSTGQSNIDSITITNTGTYWVTVNSFGINLSDTVYIDVSNKPQLNLVTDTISCVSQNIFLTYTSLGPFEYTWSNGSQADTLFNLNSNEYFLSQNDTTKNCIINSDKINIIIDSFSLKTSLGPDRVFCLDSELTFTSSQKNNEPYAIINWSTGDTTKSILLNTSADTLIHVSVSDAFGCVFSDTILAHVNTITTPSVLFVSDTVCFGKSNTLVSLSVPTAPDLIETITWTFPDNSNISGASIVQYTHSSFESFQVALTITTDSSCSNTIHLPVYLHSLPTPDFSDEIFCAQEAKNIQNLSTVPFPDSLETYLYFVNNVFVNALENPTITFTQSGLNELKLIVTSALGCVDSISKQVEVFPALIADFSADVLCVGDSVVFTDLTNSFSVIDWLWQVNGNTFSTAQNPKNIFNSLGEKTISLQIENAIGCKSTLSKTIEIIPQPIAHFSYDRLCAFSPVHFQNQSILVNDTLSTLHWQIDTLSYNTQNPTFYAYSASVIPFSLQITTEKGCSADTTGVLTIHENPTPYFEYTPNYGSAPLEVSMLNLSTDATSYSWSFGDDVGFSAEENPTYTYLENGNYAIQLTATNAFMCDTFFIKNIAVIPSELDIALNKLKLNLTKNAIGDYEIQAQVEIKNEGSRYIENADLWLSIDQETPIAKMWEYPLSAGNSVNYVFDALYQLTNITNANYVCVEARNVNDGTEINLSNNKACALLNGLIQFSETYPNPAKQIVYLDIITQDQASATLYISNMQGKTIMPEENMALQKGYNKLAIPTKNLAPGKYILKIKYLDEFYSKTFTIN